MDDTEFIAYAESVCFGSPWTPDDIRAAAQNDHGICTTERSERGEGIGYALGRVSFDEAELHRIAVLPEYRRMHAGSRLLTRFTEMCRERGAKKIFLEVRADNAPAAALYVRHGFVRISERKRYYGDTDAHIYMLEL